MPSFAASSCRSRSTSEVRCALETRALWRDYLCIHAVHWRSFSFSSIVLSHSSGPRCCYRLHLFVLLPCFDGRWWRNWCFLKEKGRVSTCEYCAVLYHAMNVVTLCVHHLQPHRCSLASCKQVLSDEDLVSRFDGESKVCVIDRKKVRWCRLALVRCEDDRLPLLKINCYCLIVVVVVQDLKFWPYRIQHNSTKALRVFHSSPEILQSLLVVCIVSPREIEARHTHACLQELFEYLHTARLWSQSADNLCESRRCWWTCIRCWWF